MESCAAQFDADAFLKIASSQPGVYKMLSVDGEVLYVGKAKHLKKRLASYFKSQVSLKTAKLVEQIADVQTIVTPSETDALILERNLIRQFKPKYNVLFRDDKSYPYIWLSADPYPRLSLYRGAHKAPGEYFGPFPNAGAAKRSLNLLQKLFSLRQCDNTYFKHRSRPCLQYQIKRCTAPCVGYVDEVSYKKDVDFARLFLKGKNQEVISILGRQMDEAAKVLDFEKAAVFRNQIQDLQKVQAQQNVEVGQDNIDVIAFVEDGGRCCIHLLQIRQGQVLGGHDFWPKRPAEVAPSEVIQAFILDYYLNRPHTIIPKKVLVSALPDDDARVADILKQQFHRRIALSEVTRGRFLSVMDMAKRNAVHALDMKQPESHQYYQQFVQLGEALRLDETPTRLECFDISHMMGEATRASCVAFGHEGPLKSDYRSYNIEDVKPGDDYAALHQVIMRRYRQMKEDDAVLPDVVIIDGGKGQLAQACDVFAELQMTDSVLLAVAKGPLRKVGHESVFMAGETYALPLKEQFGQAFKLLLAIRDEAHRFAITGHRQVRKRRRQQSVLEDIPGVGSKRRQMLLKHFGGLQGLQQASAEELAKVPGISKALAKEVFAFFSRE